MGNVIRTDALEAWKARQGGPESRREAPPTGLVAVERQQDVQALKSSLARKAGDRRPAKRSLRRTVRVESGASRKVAGKRPKSSGR